MHGPHDEPPRTGWGLPRSGAAQAPGASWAGEGQQPRPEPPPRGRWWRALLVVAVGVLLAVGALLLAGRGPEPEPVADRVGPESTEVEAAACLPPDGGAPREDDRRVEGDRTGVCLAAGRPPVGSARPGAP